MKELIKGELHKLIMNRIIWYIIGFVLLAQVIVYNSGGQSRIQKELLNSGYSGVEGEYNSDNWDTVARKLNEPNRLHPENIKNEVKTIELKKELPDQLKQKIAQVDKDLQKLGINSFEYRTLKYHRDLLSKIEAPQVFMDRGWVITLNTFTNEFFVILIILFGVCTVFSTEYSLGTDSLILTSMHGRNKLIRAKIISAVIFITAVFVLLTGFTLFYLSITNILRGWNNTLQSVTTLPWSRTATFIDSPYPFTILQFIIISALVRLVGCLTVGLFALFVSSLNRSVYTAFLVSASIVFLPVGMILFNSDSLNEITAFIFRGLLFPAGLFKTFKAYNILGYPILQITLILSVNVIFAVLFAYLTYRSVKKHQVC